MYYPERGMPRTKAPRGWRGPDSDLVRSRGSEVLERQEPFEGGNKVALGERAFESLQSIADPRRVEVLLLPGEDTGDVFEILGACGEDLRDDEVLRTDHRNLEITDSRPSRTIEELHLEPGPCKNDIQRHLSSGVNERQNVRSFDEVVDVPHSELESGRLHLPDETSGVRRNENHRDIHVRRHSRPAPDQDGLRSEDVPPVSPPV
jgi:hypothetical protein